MHGTQTSMNVAKLTNCVNKNVWTRYWENQAKAVYLKNDSSFITYEDELIDFL